MRVRDIANRESLQTFIGHTVVISHLCDEPALCYICGFMVQSSYTFSINQRCVSESCQVFQIVRRHTINSTAHPRGEAKLRMQRRLFPKRGCPFNPSLYTGCCTDATTARDA